MLQRLNPLMKDGFVAKGNRASRVLKTKRERIRVSCLYIHSHLSRAKVYERIGRYLW